MFPSKKETGSQKDTQTVERTNETWCESRRSWPILRYCARTCLEGLRKSMKQWVKIFDLRNGLRTEVPSECEARVSCSTSWLLDSRNYHCASKWHRSTKVKEDGTIWIASERRRRRRLRIFRGT
jgi:hypothetical protein